MRRLALCLAAWLALFAGPALAAIGTPISIMAENPGVGTGVASATNVDAPQGSLLIVVANSWFVIGGSITGCTLSNGDALTLAVQVAPSGSFHYGTAIFYASNLPHDLPSGGSITCVTSSGAYTVKAWAVSGANGGLDTQHTTTDAIFGSTTSLSLTTGALTSANELEFGMAGGGPPAGTYTEGSGFTNLYQAAGDMVESYNISSTTSSVTWSSSWAGGAANYSAILVSFKATAASGSHNLTTLGVGG